MNKNALKTYVRGCYDMQKLRIQTGNRICAEYKAASGQAPGEPEENMPEVEQKIIEIIRAEYKRLTDGLVRLPSQKKFQGNNIIGSYAMLALVDQYMELEKTETQQFARLKSILEEFPIWTNWMQGVRGVGPAMAGVIISEIDISKAKYASSLHRYAGLDVVPVTGDDGKVKYEGKSMRKSHMVDQTYTDSDGVVQMKKGLGYNPFLKTKLRGVLASSFLKQPADKCVYRKIYDDYKHRLENSPEHQDKSKGHRHNMAMRYCIKRFLDDLYREWRAMEGLEVFTPYYVAKLGMREHGT